LCRGRHLSEIFLYWRCIGFRVQNITGDVQNENDYPLLRNSQPLKPLAGKIFEEVFEIDKIPVGKFPIRAKGQARRISSKARKKDAPKTK
jgi:hypothetical protein